LRKKGEGGEATNVGGDRTWEKGFGGGIVTYFFGKIPPNNITFTLENHQRRREQGKPQATERVWFTSKGGKRVRKLLEKREYELVFSSIHV